MKKTWTLTAFAAGAAFIPAAFRTGLKIRKYEFETCKIRKPARLALLADLHCCQYGGAQSGLLLKIDKFKPDAVVMAGDMLDEKLPAGATIQLLSSLVLKYPCYYVTGNHEVKRGGVKKTKKRLKSLGVAVLDGKVACLKTKSGAKIAICGAGDPLYGKMRFKHELDSALVKNKTNLYTVLLSHRPEFLPAYSKYGCDLVLSGHAHGGQWRLPFLINGVYAPHQGLFPKYAGGVYSENGVNMVVSRGLSLKYLPFIPRVFNPPELVFIDILPKKA